jgi:hypothetical protein
LLFFAALIARDTFPVNAIEHAAGDHAKQTLSDLPATAQIASDHARLISVLLRSSRWYHLTESPKPSF